jgi:hypothetical protein
MDIPLTPALEFLSWFWQQTLAIRRRRPGPHFPAWLASLAPDELLWWLSFQEWRAMSPEVEEMVYVRLSFAWSKWAAMLDDGAPVPVTLGQRISVIHALVFALWERHGVEFLQAYGKTRVRDELGNSEN